MKKISTLIVLAASLMLAVTASFAEPTTDMSANWTCTTNASGSSSEGSRAADDLMAKDQTSALNAFAFAAKNCRDCTKITCTVSK